MLSIPALLLGLAAAPAAGTAWQLQGANQLGEQVVIAPSFDQACGVGRGEAVIYIDAEPVERLWFGQVCEIRPDAGGQLQLSCSADPAEHAYSDAVWAFDGSEGEGCRYRCVSGCNERVPATLATRPLVPLAPPLPPPAPPPMPARAKRYDPVAFEAALASLCVRFDGHPMFRDDRGITRISCAKLHEWADEADALIPTYRKMLSDADDFKGLARGRGLPPDLRCKRPSRRAPKVAECTSRLVGVDVRYQVSGDSGGRLLAIESELPLRGMVRNWVAQGVERGQIREYFDDWVDARAGLLAAHWASHALPGDRVEFDGQVLRLRVQR